jgi:hypothetical protein
MEVLLALVLLLVLAAITQAGTRRPGQVSQSAAAVTATVAEVTSQGCC